MLGFVGRGGAKFMPTVNDVHSLVSSLPSLSSHYLSPPPLPVPPPLCQRDGECPRVDVCNNR